jgi:p-aminobenzoyl-glutamate transporter AbgT
MSCTKPTWAGGLMSLMLECFLILLVWWLILVGIYLFAEYKVKKERKNTL